MRNITRRAFIESAAAGALGGALVSNAKEKSSAERPSDMKLKAGWLLQSSTLVPEAGEAVSRPGFQPKDWHKTQVPCTVLSTLVKNGVYPDPRVGMNTYRIPDSSDEFNRKYDLAKFSHLPDKRNPWRDPYWYRTEFVVPEDRRGQHVWLLFKGINYRADVWLNGRQIANRETIVGMFRRYLLDAGMAQPGNNCLAVKVYPVDHPGEPTPQLTALGPFRSQVSDLQKDVTYVMGMGYDCMLTQPDRDMGLWQAVLVRFTGPVDIRNPFVKTDLPLPETKPATISISAELVNATPREQSGVLRGSIPAAGLTFEKSVRLQPGETREVVLPEQVVNEPRLWWPAGMGQQPLYELILEFVAGGASSAVATTTFGIRKVTKEVYFHEKWPGLRIYINGEKCFSRGGWIQADLLLDWDEKRMDAEVQYFAQANLNTVANEDLPMMPDEFLDACDRHGVLYWNCFYSSYWVTVDVPGGDRFLNPATLPYAKIADGQKNYPLDHDLLERCTVDILKRYRNHPSLIVYSCTGEGQAGEDVYRRWRKQVLALDDTRLHVESPDARSRLPWFEPDWPTGLDDAGHTPIREMKDYYESVRAGGEWMFSTEIPFLASTPPVESLQKFIPDLWDVPPGPTYPLNSTWAHHSAHAYFRPYDTFIREHYGEPESVEDYCMKGHLVTAEHHRAVSEALNHRMWDITSGSWEWKVNSSSPDVNWQIHDWYLRPMVSMYYYRLAFEPIHIQYSYLDRMLTVVNPTLQPRHNLEAHAEVYDFEGKLLWEKRAPANAAPNTYSDVFAIPDIDKLTMVYFLRLLLRDEAGKVVSRNFYWLHNTDLYRKTDLINRPSEPHFRTLSKLPVVSLEASSTTERHGQECLTTVRLRNTSDRIAFFVHAAVLNAATGEEVLPVRWDDNYFSLVPGESREVTARHASEDLEGVTPVLDVGGWNILSPFECADLRASRGEVKTGEWFEVTAQISKTSLDGSLVQLVVDGQLAATKRVWARHQQARPVTFHLWLDRAGTHTLQIGGRTATVSVVA